MKNIFKKFNYNFISGFTIIEFMTVIAIIAVLAGMTIAVFKGFQPDLQLSGSARDLITNLRYTQQLTVTEQIKYCLKFFILEKKYQVIKCGDTQPFLEIILPNGIRNISASGFTNDQVEFNPYGAAREEGMIILENINNKIKTIEVRPSGFVRMSE